jgi:hypothetical protein
VITGLRKFIITLLVIAIASTLVWIGKITSDNYVTLISLIVGAYFTANVGSKLADKVAVTTKSQEVKQP